MPAARLAQQELVQAQARPSPRHGRHSRPAHPCRLLRTRQAAERQALHLFSRSQGSARSSPHDGEDRRGRAAALLPARQGKPATSRGEGGGASWQRNGRDSRRSMAGGVAFGEARLRAECESGGVERSANIGTAPRRPCPLPPPLAPMAGSHTQHAHLFPRRPATLLLCPSPRQVGTGYGMKELDELCQQLMPDGKEWEPTRPPPHLCNWKPTKTDDRPDVWFDPRKSVVLTVRLNHRTGAPTPRSHARVRSLFSLPSPVCHGARQAQTHIGGTRAQGMRRLFTLRRCSRSRSRHTRSSRPVPASSRATTRSASRP